MHACVVGGGIAGLYCAWRLMQRGWTVTVYEKERFGGRIRTQVVDGVVLNAGAARFNGSHRLLLKLLRELGFEQEEFVKLDRRFKYVKDGEEIEFPCYELVRKVIDVGKKTPARKLKSTTMEMFMKRVLEPSVVDDVIYAFGYNTEFESMSAHEALKLFEHDFMSDIDYYSLKGGLERVIDALKERLRGHLKIGSVSDVGKGFVMVDDKKVACDHVFVCVTWNAFQKIKGAGEIRGLGSAPLYRMFMRFSSQWFDPVRVTTNNLLRYAIPLGDRVMMVSYSDGRFAKMWSETTGVKKKVLDELKKVYPGKKIAKALWWRGYFWEEGCHYWLPGEHSVRESPGVSICGEMVSRSNHGWVEGALDSVERKLF